jgi:hypothetical protein
MNGKVCVILIMLAAITALAAGASFIDEAKVYLPFEGQDTGINSEPWQNKGTAGPGESPSDVGTEGTHTPTVASNGIKGQAFDASMMDYRTVENTYVWGEPNVPEPVDTPLEQGLIGTYSFTVTFWIKTEEVYGQGRMVGTDNWLVNNRGDYLEIHFIEAGEYVGQWNKSSVDPRGFPSVNHWRFAAITYDGSSTPEDPNILKFYTASKYLPVELDSQYSANDAQVDFGMLEVEPQIGSQLYIGNAGAESDRPFVGYIDEVRIWTSQTDDGSGVLSLEQLELVRSYDAGLCDGEKFAGDINGDCYVDFMDFADLAMNWLMNNEPAI